MIAVFRQWRRHTDQECHQRSKGHYHCVCTDPESLRQRKNQVTNLYSQTQCGTESHRRWQGPRANYEWTVPTGWRINNQREHVISASVNTDAVYSVPDEPAFRIGPKALHYLLELFRQEAIISIQKAN